MIKRIYVYLNHEDLRSLRQALGLTPHQPSKDAPELQAITTGVTSYELCDTDEGSCKINFVPCWFSADFLQCGQFYTEGDGSNKDAFALFSRLKKYVLNHFERSQDQSFYIGPGIYRDWLENKYRFPVLFRYNKCALTAEAAHALFASLRARGFLIKVNDARLRNIDTFDENADKYVIFDEKANMITRLIRTSFLHYEFGSECIFVYKSEKTQMYEFLLDTRVQEKLPKCLTSILEEASKEEYRSD